MTLRPSILVWGVSSASLIQRVMTKKCGCSVTPHAALGRICYRTRGRIFPAFRTETAAGFHLTSLYLGSLRPTIRWCTCWQRQCPNAAPPCELLLKTSRLVVLEAQSSSQSPAEEFVGN